MLYTFTPSDFNAQNDFDNFFITKKVVPLNHSYLQYALDEKGFIPIKIIPCTARWQCANRIL